MRPVCTCLHLPTRPTLQPRAFCPDCREWFVYRQEDTREMEQKALNGGVLRWRSVTCTLCLRTIVGVTRAEWGRE